MFAERNINDIFTSTKLLPEVEEMIRRSQTTTHTPDDWKSLDKDRTEFITHLESLRNNNNSPARKKFYQNQIDALLTIKPYTTPYAAFQNRGGSGMKDPSTLLNLTKPILAIRRGALDPEQVEYRLRGGQVVAFADAGVKGEPYGKVTVPKKDDRGRVVDGQTITVQRTIKGVEIRPDKTVWFVFEDDPENGRIEPERIDNQPAQLVVQNLIRSKGGTAASNKVVEALIQMGAMDEYGLSVNESAPGLFGTEGNAALTSKSENLFSNIVDRQSSVDNAKSTLQTILSGIVDNAWIGKGTPQPVIIKKAGTDHKFMIARKRDKLYVTSGAEKLGLSSNNAYTEQEIIDAFEKHGFLDFYLNNPAPTTSENPFLK